MAPALALLEKPVEALPTKTIPGIYNGTPASDTILLESPEKHQRVMNVFRAVIADICQQYGEGHAGYAMPAVFPHLLRHFSANRAHRSPMGMAAIGIALYKYVMKYSPRNCNYFNRDRFVLSNGMALLVLVLDYRWLI